EGLPTTVEGRPLTSENSKNDNLTYCSNQEQKVPVNSTPQDQVRERAKLQLRESEAVEHLKTSEVTVKNLAINETPKLVCKPKI
ncbi:hypothetical protein AVEN_126528-2-1, partial [Araneus ventricosus]